MVTAHFNKEPKLFTHDKRHDSIELLSKNKIIMAKGNDSQRKETKKPKKPKAK